MKLWGGRFTKQTEDSVFAFNESLSFDKRLFYKDIEGSIAHVVMLEKQPGKDFVILNLTDIQVEKAAGSLITTRAKNTIEKITKVYRSYGYVPIDTPILEYTDILLRKSV